MRHTILLADDSPTIQRLVNQTFADTKFDIVTVNNGDAAVRKFDEIEPDVVLADIYMPGKNGYEVCAHVKSHATLSSTPVILLVGAFDAFDDATATQAGASSHITKPFEPRALIELVTATVPSTAREKKTATPARPPKTEGPAIADAPEAIAAALMPEITAPAEIPAELPSVQPIEKRAERADLPVTERLSEPVAAGVENADLLGLENLFPPERNVEARLSEEEIEKIAERVLRKLSSQVVESIAWDVVPDIALKIVREELKKTNP